MLDYRGYGDSQGSPSESALQQDALAAVDYCVGRAQGAPVIIYGESLGGAVGIYASVNSKHRQNIGGLVLQNTFTSIPDMVDQVGHRYLHLYLIPSFTIPQLFGPLKHFKSFILNNFWPSDQVHSPPPSVAVLLPYFAFGGAAFPVAFSSFLTVDAWQLLPQVSCPVLFLSR